MTNQFESCSLMSATKLISKKWVGFIFCQLFENEKMYFNELKNGINEKSSEKVSSSAMSQTLKILEDNKVIERIPDPFHPPRVNYTLTQKGKELRLILAMLKQWTSKWDTSSEISVKCCVVEFLPEIKIKLEILD